MIIPEDDHPHLVPPEAFMTWKENWVFPAVDTERRVVSLFHFSLRPAAGEGIFTAKFNVDGHEHRYVGRSLVPRDLTTMRPVANERIGQGAEGEHGVLRAAVDAFAVAQLDDEMARLRTGMYRRGSA